jgi:hypothetical protein
MMRFEPAAKPYGPLLLIRQGDSGNHDQSQQEPVALQPLSQGQNDPAFFTLVMAIPCTWKRAPLMLIWHIIDLGNLKNDGLIYPNTWNP